MKKHIFLLFISPFCFLLLKGQVGNTKPWRPGNAINERLEERKRADEEYKRNHQPAKTYPSQNSGTSNYSTNTNIPVITTTKVGIPVYSPPDPNGHIIVEEEGSYLGEWKQQFYNEQEGDNEFAWGQRYDNDHTLPGHWYKYGPGTFTWKNGNVCKGFWMGNGVHGFAVFTWPGGYSYKGDFYWGYPNGVGEMTFPDGSSEKMLLTGEPNNLTANDIAKKRNHFLTSSNVKKDRVNTKIGKQSAKHIHTAPISIVIKQTEKKASKPLSVKNNRP